MSSNFRTTFSIPTFQHKISYQNKILSVGSCFSEHISQKLAEHKFDIITNPFGITYNPLSIKLSLEKILDNLRYKEESLFFHNELWNSFDHHSDFSNASKTEALQAINEKIEACNKQLLNAHTIIITLGTAYYYQLKETGKPVNNCHKLPEKAFEHLLFSSAEIVEQYCELIENIRSVNKEANFILTVSPVRHRNLSAEKNTLSKAHLITACHELCANFAGVFYFPSYELMIDDLRDYRFYKADMIHPNETAIEYIFEKFVAAAIDKSCLGVMEKIQQLKNNLAHKPRNEKSVEHQQFLKEQLQLIKNISAENSTLNFEAEKLKIETALQLF
jgi:lysophospholipase L1-like esterase